jgi:glycosyltransferase involved in cell wall biosynthesis
MLPKMLVKRTAVQKSKKASNGYLRSVLTSVMSKSLLRQKTAIVHDWLTGMRGGEKCLEVFCELFPDADLYTLIYQPDRVSEIIRSMRVRTSWLNHLPQVQNYYRYCLPLFPNAVERFPLKDYDMVLSSSHCVAKGVLCPRGLHIAYVHSPMRYVWDHYQSYFGVNSHWAARLGMKLCRTWLQRWDVHSSDRVNFFIANSKNIAEKIRTLYNRSAAVIYPPVDLHRFYAGESGDYYLAVAALVPYKRLEIAIDSFNRLKRLLRVVGRGPQERRLQKLAGPTVEFLGEPSDEELAKLYAGCRALIFPGEEDFGIVMLEAQASGKPVIAYGQGGALETIIPLNPCKDRPSQGSEHGADGPNPTGVFFYEQTPDALIEAVRLFEKNEHRFEAERLREHAGKFCREAFKAKIQSFIDEHWSKRKTMPV